ncbi:SIR2 family protein [Vallitalea guaymasensis]
MIFPEYTPVIGQKILTSEFITVGEIFKIHGCISLPESLVFTSDDYELFNSKKKYLSAIIHFFFGTSTCFYWI